ncbi:MAG: hypothetical protein WA354_13045 [Terracidiphilus sp.]
MNPNRVGRESERTSLRMATEASNIPTWVRAFVMVGGLLMVLGGVIALARPSILISPTDQITGGVHIYAGYFAVRNVALGLFLPLMLFLQVRRVLGSLMVLVGMIQMLDVIMDCIEGRWAIVPGVVLLGLLYFFGAARVLGAPFWSRESWV